MNPTGPHVVMLVANDLSIDTRVRKIASDVAEAGPQVTVLGISPTNERQELSLGRADVVLLPVGQILRESTHLDPSVPTAQTTVLEQKIRSDRESYFNRQRTVGAEIGEKRKVFYASRASRLTDDARALESKKEAGGSGRLFGLQVRAGRRKNSLRESYLHRTFQWKEDLIRRRLSLSYWLHQRRQSRLRRRLIRSQEQDVRQADWRTIHPELHDYEDAFGRELDRLTPDVIHAHDIHLLGVAARAVGRRHVSGNPPALIYDSHEFVPGLAKDSRRAVVGWASLEDEYIRRADRIITVAQPMAERIAAQYALPEVPEVVLNVPIPTNGPGATIRDVSRVPDEAPIVVYAGGVTPLRSVDTLARAMGQINEAHLVLVTGRDRYSEALEEICAEGGYGDRVHFLPYVDPEDVVGFLTSATVGVSPYSSVPESHRVTLTNKVFEYMHAGLPVVVSDCPATAELVTLHQIGEVFEAEDVDALAIVLKKVLADPYRYTKAYSDHPELLESQYSWRAQRKVLLSVYEDILGEEAVNQDFEVSELPALEQ